MSQPESQFNLGHLDHAGVNIIPHDTLYKLQEPLIIDGKQAGQPGEFVVVSDARNLPWEMQMLIREFMKQCPELAYFRLRTHNLIALVLVAAKIHDGAGLAVTSDPMPSPTQTEAQSNIAPWPITAEAVKPYTSRAGDLPKDQAIVLAANYQITMMTGEGRLSEISQDNEDILQPSGNALTDMLLDNITIKKGTWFTLADGQKHGRPVLLLQKYGNEQDAFPIDPNCELKVGIADRQAA